MYLIFSRATFAQIMENDSHDQIVITSLLYFLQVLERANKSEYGLAAGIFSNDVNMINSLSRYSLLFFESDSSTNQILLSQ